MLNDDIKRREIPPYWWPDANVMMQMFLAVSIVVMVGYILHALLENKITLEQAQRDLLMILLGVILACFKDAFGYTFGSSAGQKRQGEIITKSMENKDRIIADGVAATAATSDAALKAAAVIAPVAASVAAPPAAEAAAPAAAEKAVADALNKEKTT